MALMPLFSPEAPLFAFPAIFYFSLSFDLVVVEDVLRDFLSKIRRKI